MNIKKQSSTITNASYLPAVSLQLTSQL